MGDEGGFGRQVGVVGEVVVEEVDLRESVWGYRRDVDLERGIARVQYSFGETLYSR